MNRISSLRRRSGASSLQHAQKSTDLIQSSLDRLTGDLDHGRYTDDDFGETTQINLDETRDYSNLGDAYGEDEGSAVVINEVREVQSASSQVPRKRSQTSVPNCASTIDSGGSSGNHSSIFSNSNDSQENRAAAHTKGPPKPNEKLENSSSNSGNDMVKGSYSPNKSTLGLELVAPPSLLQQVLTPSKHMQDIPVSRTASAGSASTGGSTLSSMSSFQREMERTKSFDRYAGQMSQVERDQEQNQEEEEEEDDIFDDDESEYSAMQTVAQTVVSAKCCRSEKSVAEFSQESQDAQVKQPIPLRSTYSMRSMKSSEGMEVDNYFDTTFDEVEEEEPENAADTSQNQPFDESDAKMIASSKAAAALTTATAVTQGARKQPPSCLKPSSFPGQHNLVSPALVQNGRANRSARLSKFRTTLDKRQVDTGTTSSPAATNIAPEKKAVIITQVEQKKGAPEQSQPCFSAPVVSFAENLEESYPMDEIRSNEMNKFGSRSPTGVQDFFSQADKDNFKEAEQSSVNSGNSGSSTGITNRLTMNAQALKSMAMAKGKAKEAKKRSSGSREEDSIVKEGEASPAEDVMTPPIVQTVSELDIPQFSPKFDFQKELSEHVPHTKNEVKPDAFNDLVHEDESPIQEDEMESPCIEIDASALLNDTSMETTASKKKQSFLRKLRRKSKGSSPIKDSSLPPNNGDNRGKKRSIKAKLFGGKKKEHVKPETTQEKSTHLETKDTEKYVSLFAPLNEAAPVETPKHEPETASPSSNEPPQEKEESPLSDEIVDKKLDVKEDVVVPSPEEAPLVMNDAAAVMKDFGTPFLFTDFSEGLESSEVAETPLISENKEDHATAEETRSTLPQAKMKPIPFFGPAASPRSVSSKNSKSSWSSSSSRGSTSPKKSFYNPIPLEPKDRSSPCRVRSMNTDDGAPLLSNDSRIASSSGGHSQDVSDAFADFGHTSFEPEVTESPEDILEEAPFTPSGFSEELANAQIQHMFPEFGNPTFVGGDLSGDCDHGVEVEWGSSIMGVGPSVMEPSAPARKEFGDEPILLDTTAVSAALERTLTDTKWENENKVGDDISWPSDVLSRNENGPVEKETVADDDVPMKPVADSPASKAIEEASTKSGGTKSTKSSSLHPRKLFRKRSKAKPEPPQFEEEESVSDFKRFTAAERAKRDKHYMRHHSSRDISPDDSKDDSRSVNEDSEEYSSDEYSSDGREDLVETIATSLNKGFTGIVDMMETAFNFGGKKRNEDTVDYGSESSESDDDEDSYIQRKFERRREKQRKLLHDSSRRRETQHNSEQGSKSSKYRSRDKSSLSSFDEESYRARRHKSSRHKNRTSSGRSGNRHQAETCHKSSRRYRD